MTDTNPSGAHAAPAADGSGARRRRRDPCRKLRQHTRIGPRPRKAPMSASAPAATPVKSDYKPTAVEVITHEREYKNPFASQEAASAPAAEPAKCRGPRGATPRRKPRPQAADAPAAPASPPEPVAEKPEIQILPPAEAARPAVRWESPSARLRRESQPGDRPDRGSGEGRPTFRADRRDDRERAASGGTRLPPQPAAARARARSSISAPAPSSRSRRDRAPQAAEAGRRRLLRLAEGPVRRQQAGRGARRARGRAASPPARATATAGATAADAGAAAASRATAATAPPRAASRRPAGGENRGGDRQGGRRRRRHRGGFGRDRGGDPRSEGHQGGGAI